MITLEKLLLLQSAEIFKYTPEEALVELAASTTEEYFTAGDVIIQENEFDDCMYIVVYGRANIMTGDMFLAKAEKNDIFGELAALAPEKRIASVIADTDMLALKISHKIIYEIMELNVGLTKGIIHVLCQRYRHLSMQMRQLKGLQ